MSKKKKTEYLQFRITPEDKEIVEKGADLHGLDVSEYVRMCALDAANKEIENASLQNKEKLSSEEWEMFLQIADQPAPINPNLKRAFSRLEKFESDQQEPLQEKFG